MATKRSGQPHTAPSPVEDKPIVSAPIVDYQQGRLSITAENVRLSDIMSALHDLMGVEISLPAESSDERIWAHLGPGPPHKVLSDLLGSTNLDYVVQWSPTNADGIHSVSLTVRSEGSLDKAGVPNEVAVSSTDRRQSSPASSDAQPPEHDESASQQPAAAPVATASPAPTAEDGPAVATTAQSSSPTAGQFTNPPPPSEMTPDQIAQQLTNMYQQRKLMQPNQSKSTPN